MKNRNCSERRFREGFLQKNLKFACKNPITVGDFKWMFARNCERSEQLRKQPHLPKVKKNLNQTEIYKCKVTFKVPL